MSSNLEAMLKTASTNSLCLNYNGNHLIATLTDDVLKLISELPITWEQNVASGKPVKQSIYLDRWDEITSGEDAPYTVGEIVNGKIDYLNHVYLVHSDNKSLKADAQRSTRQVISLIAPYIGLVKYTVTSKTPRKDGSYMSWEWYGTTDSAIKQAFNSAIAEINEGCISAEETLESAKRWTATRQVVEDAGKAYVNKSTELVNALTELDKLKAELDKLKASKSTASK